MDRVIYYRVMSILAEMGLNLPICAVDDFDRQYCIKNFGPHRLYEFHLEIRSDVDTTDFAADLCAVLDEYNKISTIKADFVSISEYPGPAKNWSTVYLTVANL